VSYFWRIKYVVIVVVVVVVVVVLLKIRWSSTTLVGTVSKIGLCVKGLRMTHVGSGVFRKF